MQQVVEERYGSRFLLLFFNWSTSVLNHYSHWSSEVEETEGLCGPIFWFCRKVTQSKGRSCCPKFHGHQPLAGLECPAQTPFILCFALLTGRPRLEWQEDSAEHSLVPFLGRTRAGPEPGAVHPRRHLCAQDAQTDRPHVREAQGCPFVTKKWDRGCPEPSPQALSFFLHTRADRLTRDQSDLITGQWMNRKLQICHDFPAGEKVQFPSQVSPCQHGKQVLI